MNALRRVVWAACAAAALHGTAAAQRVFVVQAGTGAAPLSSASTAVSLVPFDASGAALPGTIALPTAAAGANFPFTIAGSASSEGFLKLSADGRYLTLAGYGVAPGVSGVANTTAAVAPRAVARVAVADGAVDTSTVFSGDTTFSTDNARSAVSNDGAQFWIAGSGEGVRYAELGGTTTVRLNTVDPDNNRVVDIFSGQLYVSANTAGFQGPNAVGSGLPTTEMQTVTALNGFPLSGTHSPYDFWFKDADTVYLADDGTAANGGGLQKWTQSAGVWSLAYTLQTNGTSTPGLRGLTGMIDDSNNAVLFATTTQGSANSLVKFVDTGSASTGAILATAPINTAFRGVEFVPGDAAPANNADFDSSGRVDGRDFLTWQSGFGRTGETGKTNGNANADTVINGADFTAWAAKFGGPPAVAAGAAVPEAGALVLAVLGAVVAVAAGRRAQV